MSWDYAELSKMAKTNGGPERLVDILVESGQKSMYPHIGAAFAGGIVLTLSVQKIIKQIKEKRANNKKTIETVKQELIQGIYGYDETHETACDDSEDEGNEQK